MHCIQIQTNTNNLIRRPHSTHIAQTIYVIFVHCLRLCFFLYFFFFFIIIYLSSLASRSVVFLFFRFFFFVSIFFLFRRFVCLLRQCVSFIFVDSVFLFLEVFFLHSSLVVRFVLFLFFVPFRVRIATTECMRARMDKCLPYTIYERMCVVCAVHILESIFITIFVSI